MSGADQDWTVGRISRAMLPMLVALTVVELGSGLVLEGFKETLLRYPTLLVLVPVTIGMGGNLGAVLASRLSTALHLGLLSFAADDDDLAGNALATLLQAVTLFPAVGAGAWGVQSLVGTARLDPTTVVVVATVAGVALAGLAVVVAVVATYGAYRLELDPDDVVIPVVTNTCDVLGVVVLFGAAAAVV